MFEKKKKDNKSTNHEGKTKDEIYKDIIAKSKKFRVLLLLLLLLPAFVLLMYPSIRLV